MAQIFASCLARYLSPQKGRGGGTRPQRARSLEKSGEEELRKLVPVYVST